MIREALKILAALLENCASAINERLDPPLPMVSRECAEEIYQKQLATARRTYQMNLPALLAANDETITRH